MKRTRRRPNLNLVETVGYRKEGRVETEDRLSNGVDTSTPSTGNRVGTFR